MRNSKWLDNPQPEDEFIGELQTDEGGRLFRMIHECKVYQFKEKRQCDKDLQLAINRCRALNMKPGEYLDHVIHSQPKEEKKVEPIKLEVEG